MSAPTATVPTSSTPGPITPGPMQSNSATPAGSTPRSGLAGVSDGISSSSPTSTNSGNSTQGYWNKCWEKLLKIPLLGSCLSRIAGLFAKLKPSGATVNLSSDQKDKIAKEKITKTFDKGAPKPKVVTALVKEFAAITNFDVQLDIIQLLQNSPPARCGTPVVLQFIDNLPADVKTALCEHVRVAQGSDDTARPRAGIDLLREDARSNASKQGVVLHIKAIQELKNMNTLNLIQGHWKGSNAPTATQIQESFSLMDTLPSDRFFRVAVLGIILDSPHSTKDHLQQAITHLSKAQLDAFWQILEVQRNAAALEAFSSGSAASAPSTAQQFFALDPKAKLVKDAIAQLWVNLA